MKKENPAYKRHWISQPMWIVAPILYIYIFFEGGWIFFFLSGGGLVKKNWPQWPIQWKSLCNLRPYIGNFQSIIFCPLDYSLNRGSYGCVKTKQFEKTYVLKFVKYAIKPSGKNFALGRQQILRHVLKIAPIWRTYSF